jgi:hypothetical protein
MTMTTEPRTSTAGPSLRANALGFPQLLAQSVALISPTMTAVLIIPLAFSIAGDATWFSYAFATVMLMFTVLGLNQFAKRSTTTGSMYAYVAHMEDRLSRGRGCWPCLVGGGGDAVVAACGAVRAFSGSRRWSCSYSGAGYPRTFVRRTSAV